MHITRLNKLILTVFLLTVFSSAVAFPQEAKHQPSIIHVYDEAPDFILKDLSGREVRLSAFRGKKKVVLVFYRGWVGYWWPYCERQLGELIRDYRAFQELDAEVLFVSPDKEDQARAFLQVASEFVATKSHPLGPQFAKLVPEGVQAEQILTPPFPVLLDSRKDVVSRYGILTTENDIEQPLASTFVIDKGGIVRLKYVAQEYGDRPDNRYLMEVLEAAEKPPRK